MLFAVAMSVGVITTAMALEKRRRNIYVLKDTMKLINKDPELQKATEEMVENVKLYKENFIANKNHIFSNPPIRVVGKRTMECAEELTDRSSRITILNFASGTNPGGGVKTGANTQEESICRITNLLPALEKNECWVKYYIPNKIDHSELYSDKIIYASDVMALKKDNKQSTLLDEPYRLDVITCPAPNLRNKAYFSRKKIHKILIKRIRNIMEAAIDNQTEILILGAFGCGVFMNPPQIVAKAFHEILIKEGYLKYFKEIIFAIPEKGKHYKIFKKIIE